MGESDLHLAVALDGTGWHPAAWREPAARPRELFTAGYWADLVADGRARPARLRHHRGLLRPAVVAPRRPDDRTDQVRGRLDAVLDRRPRRPADPAHRARADRGGHAHRAVPRRPRPSPRSTTSAAAGPGGGRRSRAGRPRPRTSGAGTIPRSDRSTTPTRRPPLADLFDEAADSVEVRAPAVGQLGGRRRDPRRRHRPVRRPRQAALHRLRGPHLLASRARRSRPGRRRASRSSPRSPTADVAVPVRRPVRRRRVRHAAPTRPTPRRSSATVRAEQDAAGRGGETAARLRRPRRVPRRRPAAAAAARKARLDELAGARVPSATRAIFTGTAGRARRPARWTGRPPASTGSGCGPASIARRPRRRSPTALVPGAAAARRVPHRLRGRHAARAARPRPPRQPLRRTAEARHDPSRASRSILGRALPRRQQHHGVERPARPAARSSSTRSCTSPRPPSAASSTSSSSPRACGCASRTGRSTTSTSSAAPTRFTVLAALAAVTDRTRPRPARSTPRSTSPTRWPASSPRSTTCPAAGPAWNVVTSWDAFTGENFRRGGFLAAGRALRPGREFLAHRPASCGTPGRGDEVVADQAAGHVPAPTPTPGAFATHGDAVRHPRATSTCPAARRAAR